MDNQQKYKLKWKKHPTLPIKISTNSDIFSLVSNKTLSTYKNDNGYIIVNVCGKKRRVHRLCLETFCTDHVSYGRDVNHKDGNKTNNHISNLEWCSRSENILHALETGLNSSRGETHPFSKLNEMEVKGICKLLSEGKSNSEIAEAYSIESYHVAAIKRGSIWREISNMYNIPRKRFNTKSEEAVRQVCCLLEKGISKKEVSKKTGVPLWDVNRIKRKAIWREISSDYCF